MKTLPSENAFTAFRAVADGSSLDEAGKLVGKSRTSVNLYLSKVCRAIGISFDLSEIRRNKAAHFEKIKTIKAVPDSDLHPNTAHKLVSALGLKSREELRQS